MSNDLAIAGNTFAFELWRHLRAEGNFAMSPASISTALVMAWGGASGETAAEMMQVLHLGDVDSAMTAWGKLEKQLQRQRRTMMLRMANRLFGDRRYQFEQPYLDKVEAAFGAPLAQVDFHTAAEAARVQINGWVGDQTNQQIANLLPASSLDANTRLVLVNAICFLAAWQQQFAVDATAPASFTKSSGSQVMVPTMRASGRYLHANLDQMSMLELPYKGGEAAMLVVLPDRIDGLAELERSLDARALERWRAALVSEDVSIALPRFVVDPAQPFELSNALAALGMPSAFDADRADFSVMAKRPDPAGKLFIAKVFHKAFVKVNEHGTEAAATTAVVMAARGGARKMKFAADHPFLFMIVDKGSGLILFVGRVEDPSMR